MTGRVDPIPKEARDFQGRRAGLVTRGAAIAIDVGVTAVGLLLVYAAVCAVVFFARPQGFDLPTPPFWLALTAWHVTLALYLATSWNRGGRTYGCHLMGLRVVDRKGRLLRMLPALLRAAFCVLFPVGLLWVALSRANRSVQDVVLRTSVVYDWDVRPQVRAEAIPDRP
jgi:uncharacterized RDD family membrane protein YckC